jgi:hypothetical protein
VRRGHRHADVLDYSLAQVLGYLAGHEADERAERAQLMDAVRVAVNADADDFAKLRRDLLAPPQAGEAEPAWKKAKRAFERAGSLRPGPAD